jgi:hypothetical protein
MTAIVALPKTTEQHMYARSLGPLEKTRAFGMTPTEKYPKIRVRNDKAYNPLTSALDMRV